MRSLISLALVLALGLGFAPQSWAADARPLTTADMAAMGGTDFDGGIGDLLLKNDKVEIVILGIDRTSDFGIPIVIEALPGRGIIIDAGTVGDKNDQLTEIDHLLNLDGTATIFYGGVADGLPFDPIVLPGAPTANALCAAPGIPVACCTGAGTGSGAGLCAPNTASITIAGVPLGPTAGLFAITSYSVTDGQSWVDIETTVTNFSPTPSPVFNISDLSITVSRGPLPFAPFPGRGTKAPPFSIAAPFPAASVVNYVSLPGNNGPADGPANNDGSPSGEVSYTFVADSVFTPLLSIANALLVSAGNAGAPGDFIAGFGSLTYKRKLVIAKGNSVEASLDIALPTLLNPLFFGFDPRATFTGRVVDGSSNPIPNAHIVFTNTVPGADPLLVTDFVTVVDDDQNGVADGLLGPFVGGEAFPTTHVVTAADGTFSVKLPPQLFAGAPAIPSIYTATVQAPNRGTATVPGLVAIPPFPLGPGTPTALGDIVLSDTGTLSFTVNDVATASPTPAKLTILGTDGTDNPDFGSQFLSLRNFPGLSKRTGDGGAVITTGNSTQLGEQFAGTPALNFHTDEDGTGTLDLAPGDYIVFASRGLEYTIDIQEFSVTAGSTTSVTLDIERVVDTTGFVSMDFHVHSTKSFDSSVPLTDRVKAFLAEGVDVLVSTDHDFISDYAPIIASLGAGSEIASIIGSELTGGIPVPSDFTQLSCDPPGPAIQAFPEGIGHWNGWPLDITALGNRSNGAVASEFITPGTAIDRLRGQDELAFLGATPDDATVVEWVTALNIPGDDEVVMFNHPRAGLAGTVVIGMFNGLNNPGGNPVAGGYDPTSPITDFPNCLLFTPSLYNAVIVGGGGTSTNALSFDAIEVLNGPSLGNYVRVREDWYSLLDQGINKAGTAVSDSHRLILENAGFARSFVASSTDDPGAINESELTANVKALNLMGTNGPFIRFSIEDDAATDVGMGGTAVVTGNKVTLRIRVEAAPWIPVEEVRIFRNGTLIETRAVQSSKVLGKVLRFNKALPLQGIDADSYFTVEAGVRIDANGQPLSPGLLTTVQTIESGVVPLGFTNPIFVDRDGGGYVPPGQ